MNRLKKIAMIRCCLLTVAVCLALAASRPAAAVTISVPANVTLERNTPGQVVPIVVFGTEAIAGMTLAVQVADGGPGPITQGLIDGPDITAIDLLTGGIFGPNNEGVDDPGSYPQFALRSVTTLADTTIPLSSQPSLLGMLTLSTVGVAPGTYALLLGGVPAALSSTEFYTSTGAPITPTFINGALTIVPEPSTLLLAGMAAVGAVVAANRRRAIRRS
jgi:hypothetical protein